MAKKKQSTTKHTELELDETIDISSLSSFNEKLNKLLRSSKPVVVNAAKVKRIDTSALQLLCSWYQASIEKNIEIKWKNIDGIFFNSAKRVGLAGFLTLE